MEFEAILAVIFGVAFLALAILVFVIAGGVNLQGEVEESKEDFMCEMAKQMIAREGPEAEKCDWENECYTAYGECNDKNEFNACVCKNYKIADGKVKCLSHQANMNPTTVKYIINREAYCKE